jgi:hypothetical protein
MFPATVIEAATIASSERYLDGLAEGSGQRRLIVEGRDGLDRALRARAVDSQS